MVVCITCERDFTKISVDWLYAQPTFGLLVELGGPLKEDLCLPISKTITNNSKLSSS